MGENEKSDRTLETGGSGTLLLLGTPALDAVGQRLGMLARRQVRDFPPSLFFRLSVAEAPKFRVGARSALGTVTRTVHYRSFLGLILSSVEYLQSMISFPGGDDLHLVCKDTSCALLPIGFALLAVDSYYDLRWVFQPSPTTDKELRWYYTLILAPRWKPLPHPGYFFPFYVIYKLCVQCPTSFNYMLLALFVPISYRYVGILNLSPSEKLQHWWTVVALRVGLAIVNILALRAYGDCTLQHTVSFLFGRK